jgi:hypothetical protein
MLLKNYFRDFWNILDFVIVVGSIFDIAMIFVSYKFDELIKILIF